MVRTRIAPSPTGFPHIGTAYQALLDYAFAKKHKGKFILRIEDTDIKRIIPGAEKAIYQALSWLGLEPDEGPQQGGPFGPYRQSERLKLYQKYAHALVKKGKAYFCFCSQERLKKLRQKQQAQSRPPMYDKKCRFLSSKEVREKLKSGQSYVIRMKIPENEKIIVHDLIRGKVVFDSNLIDDQILLKSDGFPTYHLAVVVDDHLMKISHVVRGEEWLSSAPKHILLYRFFGWKPPYFIHTPLLRNPDKTKLSKREGHTSIFWYQKKGYLPEALINFLSLLGWSHPKEKEVFPLDEFIKYFRFEDLSPVGPVFDLKKLDWLNGLYIRQKPTKELVRLIKPFAPQKMSSSLINRTIPLVRERMTKLSDYFDLVDFLIKEPKIDSVLLIEKSGGNKKLTEIYLKKAFEVLKKISFKKEKIEKELRKLVENNSWHLRNFFMALRIAITGKTVTPPLFESMEILGKKKTTSRLQKAIQVLD